MRPFVLAAALLFRHLGGSGTDDCDGIALDRAGDIYLGCHSDSPEFGAPAHGSMDAVIVKLSARTGEIVWTTRTGGSDWDAAGDLTVMDDGSIIVLGQTQSADFPTTPDAVQRKFGGPRRDVFVLKLDANGKIVYSTFLGGSKNDEATSLAVAHDGTVYVGGTTWSDDLPGVHAAQFGPGGGSDGFVSRFRPGVSSSLQTVRIGGSGRDPVAGIALDQLGNLLVACSTSSPDFPLKNALKSKINGDLDACLLKLRVSDWNLQFSTYLGGSKLDGAGGVAVDSAGSPIVSGITASSDFPTTPGAFQAQLRGNFDAFVTKLDRDGQRILWSTHYGGTSASKDFDDPGSIAIDDAGRVWLTGMTSAADLPTREGFQPAFGGGDRDGFLAAFSSDGSKLLYGTYVGGAGHDILEGLAIGKGKVYASGLTTSKGYDAMVVGIDTTHLAH